MYKFSILLISIMLYYIIYLMISVLKVGLKKRVVITNCPFDLLYGLQLINSY